MMGTRTMRGAADDPGPRWIRAMRGGRRRERNDGENAGMADRVSGKCGSPRTGARGAREGSAAGNVGKEGGKERRKEG